MGMSQSKMDLQDKAHQFLFRLVTPGQNGRNIASIDQPVNIENKSKAALDVDYIKIKRCSI